MSVLFIFDTQEHSTWHTVGNKKCFLNEYRNDLPNITNYKLVAVSRTLWKKVKIGEN